MVDALKKIFTRETAGLHQAAFLLGIFALASQVLALVRDKLLAATFGASGSLDVYYAAFRIPDFLFVTLGSVVSLTILIPFLSSVYTKGEEETKFFIDSIFTIFLFSISFVACLVGILTPALVSYLFPGFSAVDQEQVVMLTRILLLSPVFLGVSNILGSITQSHNRFFTYAVSPVFYNVGIIAGILVLYPTFGIVGLALGVCLGAMFHLLVQIPSAMSLRLLPRITFRPQVRKVGEVIAVAIPRTLTLSVSHIAIFFLISLASLFASGSITVFSFAFNLQSVPLSIFGVSYSLAAFPSLSKLFVSGERDMFVSKLLSSARHIVFWAIPCTVLFIVLRAHIVRVVLGSGAFSWNDTKLTAATLALFSISLVFQSLVLLFVRALYAGGATGKPFYISVFSGLTMVVSAGVLTKLFTHSGQFSFVMEELLKVSGVPGSEVMMLALGFTIGSIVDCLLLWYVLRKEWRGFSRSLLGSMYRVGMSSIIAGFVSYMTLYILGPLIGLETFFTVFSQLCVSAFFGMGAYVLTMMLLKSQEIYEMADMVKKKVFGQQTISPDASIV